MDPLAKIFEGWDGYQTSLTRAIAGLTPEQLTWRPAPGRRSIGELTRHISLGRITWFARMPAPGIEEVAALVPRWATDGDGARHAVEQSVPADDAADLVAWLERSWAPIRRVLDEWTADDLSRTYRHRFRGTDYAVSRQWTIWRILSHDCHHGGQIAMMLAIQGIERFELRALGGHITEPPHATG
jgi:uncharacterized damage-inducible protein DinB